MQKPEPQKISDNSRINLILEIPKFIPFLTIITFVCSSLDLIIYYSYFNINIFKYLELNEIFTQVLNDLLLNVFIFLIMAIIPQVVIRKFKVIENHISRTAEHINYHNVVTIFLLILIILEIEFMIEKDLYNLFFSLGIFIPIFFLYILLLEFRANKKFLMPVSKTSMLAIVFSVYIITQSVVFSFFHLLNVRLHHIYSNTDIEIESKKTSTINGNIVIESKIVKSTNSYYFIGQTNNNIFFYNEANNTTDCYFTKDVTKVTLSHIE